MDTLKKCFKRRDGFTYIELMVGMVILLVGVSFFAIMYRYSNQNKIIARERMAMATVAQNVVEVFQEAGGTFDARESAARTEAEDYNVDVVVNSTAYPGYPRLRSARVVVTPKPDFTGIIGSQNYVLDFITLDKSW